MGYTGLEEDCTDLLANVYMSMVGMNNTSLVLLVAEVFWPEKSLHVSSAKEPTYPVS